MKSSLSSFDIAALIPELNETLKGAFLDKIYQPERDELLLVFSTKSGKRDVLLKAGKYFFMGRKGENPQEPSGMVMFLRKNMGNARVSEIRQHGFDRIVEIELEKSEKYTIIAEFFRNGNISVVKDGIILIPLFFQRWSTRALIPKEEYRYPPESADPRELERDEISERLKDSDKDLVRTLATRLNLGGTYAEEICLMSGIDKKKKASELEEYEIDSIVKALSDLFSREKNPVIYYEGGEPKDVSPFPLRAYEGLEKKAYETMNSAVFEYFTSMTKEEKERKSPAAERIERQIAQQERSIVEFGKGSEDAKHKAEIIYGHYGEIEALLSKLRNMKGKDFASLKELPYFVSVRPDKKLITIKIDDEAITLDFAGVNESAQRYYNEAKKLRDKIDGAKKALEESKKKLEKVEQQSEKAKKTKKSRKKQWFERYRWFISSDENLVIAGKDAKTNERVVKKHMKDTDIYAHAEIHGAPSVIVKKNGDEQIGEDTLREACEFALCFSKAWPSKIGGGAAYWVKPNQVSKTPEAGEFLSRGAFVIRGKRNYIKSDLKLAVGMVNYGDSKLPTCAPVSAMQKWCDEYYIIVPGDERKEKVAKMLAQELGAEVDEMVSALPSGGIEMHEKKKGEGKHIGRKF